MAPTRSKHYVSFVILLHFDIISIYHVYSHTIFDNPYIFTSTDIMDICKDKCFIGIPSNLLDQTAVADVNNVSVTSEHDETLQYKLNTAYVEDTGALVGYFHLKGFQWPSGKSLKNTNQEIFEVSDLRAVNLVVFPKLSLDRTCLSTQGTALAEPSAEVYSGSLNMHILTQFINEKCNLYRSPNGFLTVEGLHRQEILKTFYKVDSSYPDMKSIFSFHESSQFCIYENCSQTMFNAKYSKKENQMQNNFKNLDLGMKKCDKIELPAKDEFFHNFLKKSKPVIIKNATKHWAALEKWTNEYFSTTYGNENVHIKLTPSGEFEGVDFASNFDNFNEFKIPKNVRDQLIFPDLVVVRPAMKNMKFSEFIDLFSLVSNKTMKNCSAYLEYSSIADIMADIVDDIVELPLLKTVLELKHLNIWLSDGDTLGKLHFDPFDNFLCQISGRKQVILFDPHDNQKLYEAHIPEAVLSYNLETNTFRKQLLMDSTSMVMSPVDITNPAFERFPLFGEVRPLNCTIEEGDVLFIPSFWWHEVQSYPNVLEGRNLAVNFWYDPFLTKEFPCQYCKMDINPKYRHLL